MTKAKAINKSLIHNFSNHLKQKKFINQLNNELNKTKVQCNTYEFKILFKKENNQN